MRPISLYAFLLASSGGVVAVPASAQPAPVATAAAPDADQPAPANQGPAATPAEQAGGQAAIVVTARKRDERLIDVPVVVTVQNREVLERYNATDLTRIAELTPSVIVSSQRGQGGGSIAIRGISSPATQVGFEQAVSVAIDGVQSSNGRVTQMGFFDLQQVEVLKGPQALFFGKNNTGGVMSITTAGATNTFQAAVRSSYEFVGDEATAEAAVSGPFSDTLSGRIAVRLRYLNGWMRNTAQPIANPFYSAATGAPAAAAQLPGTHARRPGEKEILGRATLAYRPSNRVSAVLKYFAGHSVDDGPGAIAQNIGPCTGPFPRMYGIADPNAECVIDNRTTVGDVPSIIAGTFQSMRTDGKGRGELDATIASLNLNADLGKVSLAGVTGYTRSSYNSFSGFDQTSYSQLVVAELNKQTELSQEVRLNSNLEGPFNFMVGGYAQTTKLFLSTEDILNDANYVKAVNSYDSFYSIAKQRGHTYSVFGQGRIDLGKGFEFAAGARWTDETKTFNKRNLYGIGAFNTVNTIFPGSTTPGVLMGKFHDSNISPEATLTWHVDPDVTLFGAYRTGFKAGGFGLNTTISTAVRIGDADYNSEKAKGFEVGARGRILDRKLYFSAAAFAYNFSDLQVNVFDPARVAYVINNAGQLRQRGFEVETSYDATRNFNVHGALAYVHNRFRNYTGQCYGYAFPTGTTRATAVPPPNCSFVNSTSLTLQQVYDGRAPARSPELTGNAGFVATQPVGNDRHIEVTGDAYYSDSYYAADTLIEASRQPSFWRFNASISLAQTHDRWKLSLIGRNLTNKYYLLYAADRTGGASVPGAIGEQRGLVARGREVLLQAALRF